MKKENIPNAVPLQPEDQASDTTTTNLAKSFEEKEANFMKTFQDKAKEYDVQQKSICKICSLRHYKINKSIPKNWDQFLMTQINQSEKKDFEQKITNFTYYLDFACNKKIVGRTEPCGYKRSVQIARTKDPPHEFWKEHNTKKK